MGFIVDVRTEIEKYAKSYTEKEREGEKNREKDM